MKDVFIKKKKKVMKDDVDALENGFGLIELYSSIILVWKTVVKAKDIIFLMNVKAKDFA